MIIKVFYIVALLKISVDGQIEASLINKNSYHLPNYESKHWSVFNKINKVEDLKRIDPIIFEDLDTNRYTIPTKILENRDKRMTKPDDVVVTSIGKKFVHNIFAKKFVEKLMNNENKTRFIRFVRYPLQIEQDEKRKLEPKQLFHTTNAFPLGVSLLVIYSGIILSALLNRVIVNLRLSIGIQAPLLLYGIIVGVCFRLFGQSFVTNLTLQQYQILIYLAVPLTLYRGYLFADVHGFRKNLLQALVISVPGLLANAMIVGIAMRYVLQMNWTFASSAFFGTACVFTYPRKNIERMKHLDPRPQQISQLLEGEFIIGTILAFVLYTVWFSGYLTSTSVYQVSLNILRYLSGILIGLFTGMVNCFFCWTLSSNVLDMILFSTITPLLAFFLCFTYLKASGMIAITICGLMMASERIVLNKSSRIVMGDYWRLFGVCIDALVLTSMGFFVGLKYVYSSDSSDYVYIVLMYCTTYFGRFLILAILRPLSNKLGYNLDFRSLVVFVCGGVPSLINICYTLLPSSNEEIDQDVKPVLFFYVTGLVIISLLLNVISLPHLSSFLKLDAVSSPRGSEMKLCIAHLRHLKMREFFFMKIESLMGETDWAQVEYVSSLKNPYFKESSIHEDDETDDHLKYCPDCEHEIFSPQSYVEYPKQRAATNWRVLKTRETMLRKMFSETLLCRKSFVVLNRILKEAYDNPNNYLRTDDLINKFHVEICSHSCMKKCNNCSICRINPTQIRPPNFYWRRLCYHMIKSEVFQMIISGILILNTIFIITEAFVNPEPISQLKYTFTFLDAAFLMFYTSEWLIHIAGRARKSFWGNGFVVYLRSPINIFDCIVLLIVWTSFLVETSCYASYSAEIFLYENRLWFSIFKSLRALRLIRLLKYAQRIVIKIRQNYRNRKLMEAFDIGKDFLIQEKMILNILPNICDNFKIRCDIEDNIEIQLHGVVGELHNVDKNFAWISRTVRTKYATKFVINAMRSSVNHSTISGWTDNTEKAYLNAVLNSLLRKVKSMRSIEETDREMVFGDVPWMKGYPKTTEALFKKVETRKFDAKTCIFEEGDESNGIYIIITGVCAITYIPDNEILSRLRTTGELPIVDNISSENFDKPTISYAVTGMTIGELGFLTGRRYASTVSTYSPCEAYFLSSEVLLDVMKNDSDPINGLECRLWKNVSRNMATEILLSISKHDFEEVYLYDRFLTRSYMPQIDQSGSYNIKRFIRDTVLIEGVVQDEMSGKLYTAPCRIPRKIRDITFPRNQVLTRLLFIPREDIDDYGISFQ